MNIGYLTNAYPKVSHTFIRREILALEARGFQVTRFSIRGTPDRLSDPEDVREAERTTVLIRLGLVRLGAALLLALLTRPLRFAKALNMAWRLGRTSERGHLINLVYLVWACVLLRRAAAAKCTHLHVHFGTNPASVALLCKLLGGPTYSFTVHGPEEFDKPVNISLAEKIAGCEFVAAVSSFGRSQLYRHCHHTEWHKVLIVRCGVDDTFVELRADTPPPGKHLVCVGRICEQKGQLLLLKAVAGLRDRGVRVPLTLVGDGELRSEAERLIATLKLQDLVSITGWATNQQVREALLGSRAMVLPSFAEGLPVVIMEALCLERPVLSTYVAGIPELVQDGVSGWLVPAGSIEALEHALEKVLRTDDAELSRLGAEGRRRVLEQHVAKDAVLPLVDAFEALGAARVPSSSAEAPTRLHA